MSAAFWKLSPKEYHDMITKANDAIKAQQQAKNDAYYYPSLKPINPLGESMIKAIKTPVSVGVDLAKHEQAAWDTLLVEPKPNTYTTGSGQVLKYVHAETPDCAALGCVIHNPTDPHQDWPTHWEDGIMWRRCSCGELHPDLNHCNFVERTFGYDHRTHYCDCQCCKNPVGPIVEGHAADLLKAMGLGQ